jgi:hypothetical protein
MEQEGYLLPEEKEFTRFYKLSMWWVNHRTQVQRLGLILLGVVDAAILSYVVWQYADAYLLSYDRENAQVAQLATGVSDLSAFTSAEAGKDLVPSLATVLSSGDGAFDFYATVQNQNADLWAEYDYAFTAGDFSTPVQKGFVLPGETKPELALSVASASVPLQATLTLTAVRWHRVDTHLTGSYDRFSSDHLNLPVTNVVFTPDLVVDGNQHVGRVSFHVDNATAYSYYDPVFLILLKRGSAVVGVNRTTLSALDSGQGQDVDVNWFGTVPSASEADVVPEINIFDPSVYKPLGTQ